MLIFTLFGSSVSAKTSVGDEIKSAVEKTTEAADAQKPVNDKLRTDILKLLADAKAGKVAPAPRPQIQPRQSNNLSKGTKIAIGGAIAIAIVVTIVAVKADKDAGPIGAF